MPKKGAFRACKDTFSASRVRLSSRRADSFSTHPLGHANYTVFLNLFQDPFFQLSRRLR